MDNFRAPGKEYDPELFMINLNHYSRFAGTSLPWELSSNFKYGRMRAHQIMWLAYDVSEETWECYQRALL